MKYAIVESGGKQYKVVAGEPLEVDRLPLEVGAKLDFESVLLVVDGEDVTVGTPTVNGVQVKATVLEHFKGRKLIVFKYSPKKRIRVKRGHRQQYTRLMVDTIGKPGESSKAAKAKKAKAPVAEKAEVKAEKKVEEKESTATSSPKEKKPATKKTEKAPAKKAPAKKAEKASATSAPKEKKTTAKKTTTKETSSTKKSEK